MTWLTAQVTFRETPPTAHTTTFDFPSPILPDTTAVSDVFVQGGQLAGVDSAIIGFVTISGDPNPTFNGSFYISYQSPFSDDSVSLLADVSPSAAPNFGEVFLYRQTCVDGPCRPGSVVETATVDSFFRVPEPATLGLLFAAVAGGWVTARRKRRGAQSARAA